MNYLALPCLDTFVTKIENFHDIRLATLLFLEENSW